MITKFCGLKSRWHCERIKLPNTWSWATPCYFSIFLSVTEVIPSFLLLFHSVSEATPSFLSLFHVAKPHSPFFSLYLSVLKATPSFPFTFPFCFWGNALHPFYFSNFVFMLRPFSLSFLRSPLFFVFLRLSFSFISPFGSSVMPFTVESTFSSFFISSSSGLLPIPYPFTRASLFHFFIFIFSYQYSASMFEKLSFFPLVLRFHTYILYLFLLLLTCHPLATDSSLKFIRSPFYLD